MKKKLALALFALIMGSCAAQAYAHCDGQIPPMCPSGTYPICISTTDYVEIGKFICVRGY